MNYEKEPQTPVIHGVVFILVWALGLLAWIWIAENL